MSTVQKYVVFKLISVKLKFEEVNNIQLTMEQIESALENAPKLHWADYLVIGIYFAGLLGIGYWVS